MLSGAEDLVSVHRQDPTGAWVLDAVGNPVIHEDERDGYVVRRYRPRIEGLFARIERWTRALDGDVHWRSISKDNIFTLYGKDGNSRIADPEEPDCIFTWLICETRDDNGNGVVYAYKAEDDLGVDLALAREHNRGGRDELRRTPNRYLKSVRYGNRVPLLDEGQRPRFLTQDPVSQAGRMFEVVLDYGEHDAAAPTPRDASPWLYRDDPVSSYRAGFEVRTTRLCRRVLMFHQFPGEADVGADCLVRSTDFTYSHHEDAANANSPVYALLRAVTQSGYRRHNGGYPKRSLTSVEYEYSQPIVQNEVYEVDTASLEKLPIGVDGDGYQWTELHGEGIAGILAHQVRLEAVRRPDLLHRAVADPDRLGEPPRTPVGGARGQLEQRHLHLLDRALGQGRLARRAGHVVPRAHRPPQPQTAPASAAPSAPTCRPPG